MLAYKNNTLKETKPGVQKGKEGQKHKQKEEEKKQMKEKKEEISLELVREVQDIAGISEAEAIQLVSGHPKKDLSQLLDIYF